MASYSPQQLLEIARVIGVSNVWGRLVYPLRRRRYEAGGSPAALLAGLLARRGESARPEPLGDLLDHQVAGQPPTALGGQVLDLHCTNFTLRLEVLADDLLRLRLRPAGAPDFAPLFSYALDPDATWPPRPFALEKGAEALTIRTAELTCRVQRRPCRLAFFDAAGRPLSEPAEGLGLGQAGGGFVTRRLAEAEALYGLGEKAFNLNLRGRAVEMWNSDPETYGPGDDPIDLCIPLLIGLREGRAYGLFFDNPGRARLDLGQARSDILHYEADSGELCFYFLGGPTIDRVLESYTHLTGRMPLPPRWLLGYHQSRWSYYPEAKVRELAADFRRRRIPCDVIHLDIHYLDGYRIFTWDRERFPDPPRLLADLRRQGLRAIGIVDPGVKVDPGYAVHDEGLARGAFCALPDGRLFHGPVWPGACYFPDFTDPGVREWWGGLYEPLLEAGLAGFWNDMNEPAIFGGAMAHTVRHSYEGRGASHGEVHNIYGLQMARASAEGLRRLRPDERLPLISRAGYAGLQRYALVWTADNHSTWADLRLGVSMCLNLGLSGLALCGPDVGGFAGDCDGELLARWTQVGALTPFFRNHSALGSRPQEPWAFGPPYEAICRRWIELRYELLPYLYTAAWQAARSGLPMMRPLALAFPGDVSTYSLDDQFLLGDSLLAAPVGQPGQRARPVYLPGGHGGQGGHGGLPLHDGPWYDFWSDEPHSGWITAEAPLERMPLYVRAGTVLPLAPVMQHTGEWPPPALRLHVYPGDGQSWLYEDDGHSLAYRDGAWQQTRFVCQASSDGLLLRREVEGPYRPGYDRFEIHLHGLAGRPRQVLVDGCPAGAAFDAESGTAQVLAADWTRLEVAY